MDFICFAFEKETVMRNRLNYGQILLIASLIALLIAAVVWGGWVWQAVGDVAMGEAGWVALIMGTLFSLLVGCGLMALMFVSNRGGYDEAADPLGKHDWEAQP